MIKKRINTPFYIIISFISPIFLAWIMSQTEFAKNPTATTNQGLLINQKTTWALDDLNTPKMKMWKVVTIVSSPDQCEKVIKHADASIVLLKDQAKRVHLFTPDVCKKISTQTASTSINTVGIEQNLKQFFPETPHSAYYELIVDPHSHVTMLYTDQQAEKALLKDMQVLLKYSKVG